MSRFNFSEEVFCAILINSSAGSTPSAAQMALTFITSVRREDPIFSVGVIGNVFPIHLMRNNEYLVGD